MGVDSKALLATIIRKLPVLIGLAVTGAVLGSGLNLLITLAQSQNLKYVSETEYYIEFAEGRYEARDYYNDFTWNDVIGTDLILGRMMELLGTGYDREEVKGMMTADILSDVRYLTVTVKGEDADKVYQVKEALGTALSEFGSRMDEFSSIYKIDDLEITKENISYFGVRAALLGAFVFAFAGLFVIALRFSAGSSFYTKNDISKTLGIPVYGMIFKSNKNNKRQEEMLVLNMKMLTNKYSSLFLLDAGEGKYAEKFVMHVNGNKGIKPQTLKPYVAGYDEEKPVLAVVPFGVPYREKITDEINNARLRGANVIGAVIVDADVFWNRIYMG
jgi:capsular polysaccharide biosynthesis protein